MTKYIYLAVLLLVSVSVGLSQGYTTPIAPKVVQVQLNDSVAVSATYAANQADTTIAYQLSGYFAGGMLITTTDSVRVFVYVLPSGDGTNYTQPPVLIDSVRYQSTGVGGAGAINFPANVFQYPSVKLQLVFQAAGQGVTTPKYTAKLVLKN